LEAILVGFTLADMRKFIFILSLLFVFSLITCNKATRQQEQNLDFRFQRGQQYFDDGKYYKALNDFNFVVLNSPGSPYADDAQLYIADCYYNQDEYIVAVSEYQRLMRRYPESPLIEQAQYKLSMCFVELSPTYKLDQSYTEQAINTMQSFLENFPNSEYKEKITKLIGELRDKLAHKKYTNARLYYVLRQYDSAIIYLDQLLEQYYDTDWANPGRLLRAKSLLKMGRNEEAATELGDLLSRDPKEDIKTEATALLHEATQTPTPASQTEDLE